MNPLPPERNPSQQAPEGETHKPHFGAQTCRDYLLWGLSKLETGKLKSRLERE